MSERIAIVGARDASAELRRIAHALGACHCWDFGCEPADLATILERIHHLDTIERESIESRLMRPLAEWHDDRGAVLWWALGVGEPPYAGTPLDDDFPDHVTHWTPIPEPIEPFDPRPVEVVR